MMRWTRRASDPTRPSPVAGVGGQARQAATAEYVIRGGGRTVHVALIASPARGVWIPVVGEGEAPRRWTRLSAWGMASRAEAIEVAAVTALLLLGGDAPAGSDEL